jgi:hypothetical protein
MKKNLEKILITASIVIAVVLIMVLLITAFGGIDVKEFDSQLVRGLLITFAVMYLLLAIASLIMVFLSSDAVKEIMVRSEQKGSVRVSIGVVRKMVKETCAKIEGVKCQKVNIITDDYGVRLKIGVKMTDKDVTETETYIRAMLEDMFHGALGFKFHTIEIKVISLKAKYQIDDAVVDEKVQKRLAAIEREERAREEAELKEEAENALAVSDTSENEAEAVSQEEAFESENEAANGEETVEPEANSDAVAEEAAGEDDETSAAEEADGIAEENAENDGATADDGLDTRAEAETDVVAEEDGEEDVAEADEADGNDAADEDKDIIKSDLEEK